VFYYLYNQLRKRKNKMNPTQKTIIFIALILFLGFGIFIPYNGTQINKIDKEYKWHDTLWTFALFCHFFMSAFRSSCANYFFRRA